MRVSLKKKKNILVFNLSAHHRHAGFSLGFGLWDSLLWFLGVLVQILRVPYKITALYNDKDTVYGLELSHSSDMSA